MHLFFDSLASLSVILGGLLITFYGWYYADAYAAIFIGAVVILSVPFILWKVGYLLLEGVPENISIPEIKSFLLKNENVTAVHDLHVWNIATNYNILTAHLSVKLDKRNTDEFLHEISTQLRKEFPLHHLTIQCEIESCEYGKE